MQLMRKYNSRVRFLLCIVDIFDKYPWVFPLKGKRVITITNAFEKVLLKSRRKPNEIWVDKGSEFWNRSTQSYLQDNTMEMYSTHSEGKSVVVERLINICYKYMTSISKNE